MVGVGVVIVTWNSSGDIGACLDALGDQEVDVPVDVVVVDNGSTDGTRDVVRDRSGVTLVEAGYNAGYAHATNRGIDLVRGDTVLLLNPDAEVSADDVAALQAALRARDDLASVGPVQVDEQARPARVEWPFPSPAATWREAVGLGAARSGPTFVIGSVLLLRAEALAQVGGLDERFFLYAEETDWAYRAHLLGWRHAAVPEVRALHVGAGTSGDSMRREAHFHASQERYLRKHFGSLGWQVARTCQWVGSMARALTLPGERGRDARRRAALYRLGPVRVEARFRSASSGHGTGPGASDHTAVAQPNTIAS